MRNLDKLAKDYVDDVMSMTSDNDKIAMLEFIVKTSIDKIGLNHDNYKNGVIDQDTYVTMSEYYKATIYEAQVLLEQEKAA